jgi:hypothetical protein
MERNAMKKGLPGDGTSEKLTTRALIVVLY